MKTREVRIINIDEVYVYGEVKIADIWFKNKWEKKSFFKFAKDTKDIQLLNKNKLLMARI